MAYNENVKPDFKKNKAALREIKSVLRDIKKLRRLEEEQKSAVRTAIGRLHGKQVEDTLKSISVEQLNSEKQGIRISALRDAGIENIYQVNRLCRKNTRQLCGIKGIGDKTAEKIMSSCAAIVASTGKTTRVRLSAEGESPAEKNAIKALFTLVNAETVRRECGRLGEEIDAQIKAAASAKRASGRLAWLFTPRSKRESAVRDAESLTEYASGALREKANAINREMKRIASADSGERIRDFKENSAKYYACLESIDVRLAGEETARSGLPSELAASIDAYPIDLRLLKATLRGYQTFGVKYILAQKRTLLGDEMGLGKTVEAIAAMAALRAEGVSRFLVVCPASVLVNWCREMELHSELKAIRLHGEYEAALEAWIKDGGTAVTTYETLRKMDIPEDMGLDMLVVDEAHYVKNPEALRTKALARLADDAERVLFMTGTPLENRVEEMCTLIGFLQPDIARQAEGIKYLSAAPQFREKIAPVYLRRTREDVLKELPELIEKEEWCELSRLETDAYREAVLSGNFMRMRQVSWLTEDLSQSAKAVRLKELCDMAAEDGRKVIVFSFFRDTIAKVCALLGERCLEPITGSVSPQQRQNIIDGFKESADGSVLVAQIQAGGTGLNIQTASVIIFCEPQIKPSLETQAISRAYRMGQLKSVLVYRLLSEDSVDEHVIKLLKDKQELFDSFADESVIGEENLKMSEKAWMNAVIEEERARLT